VKKSFRLYTQTISVNCFYTGDKRFKSAAARDWTLEVINQMNQSHILNSLKELRDSFTDSKAYRISFEFAYPESIMYTKKGTISSKTIDISNGEKHLLDILCLPKFFSEIQNLNIDDKFVVEMNSKKIVSENDRYYINITIEIVDTPQLEPAQINSISD
jgi:Holliday junction resolvase RusA-like endonuclease